MFTGLIETVGTIRNIRKGNTDLVLEIAPGMDGFEVKTGDSVAIDGVCLTVESTAGPVMSFRAVYETLTRTVLQDATPGTRVNLERSLRISDRLGGHFVLGHVDGVGRIMADRPVGESIYRSISAPEEIRPLMAQKGSVAVDGISLTIAESLPDGFVVSFIPHTLKATTMGQKHVGNRVNIECDVLARYIFHILSTSSASQPGSGERNESLFQKLEKYGF
jgi:riboflavin synthase